ncbi:MAG: peroxiredoxin [Nitrospinae bacterium]|nr:peroxiredoxin [Nitrospinota bacterium]
MASKVGKSSVAEGAKAPDFTLPDQDGRDVSLKDYAGKWLVLYFYPKDNTPGCTIEAKDFTALMGKLTKMGAAVAGVSPDSVKSHCNFIGKQGLKITLLSDPERKVVKKYGAWGVKKMYGRESEGLVRSTFLITPEGRVARAWNGVKAAGHAEEVVEAVKRLLSV